MQKKTHPNKYSMFVRSLIFSITVPIFTIFYSLFCVACFPLPLRYRYNIVMGWTHTIIWWLKVLCHIDYRVQGLENIPQDRGGIVMSKHQSAWETFFLPGMFYQTAIILKRELMWVPFFGWGLAVTSPIAINRGNRSSAMAQIIKQGKKYIKAGRWILVFPEGTRIAPGQVGKYRLGGARLAVETGSPVLPVAHNAGHFWSKRKFMKRPGTVQVVFGPIIESIGRKPEEVMELTQNWIEETMLKIDAIYRQEQR